ncbi:hypothetical protein N7528_004956 [Penicillium herquei]|nr:hypothetical protein N7528_004956 [Penicillium herquei]
MSGIQQQALERLKNVKATALPHLTDDYTLECVDHTKTPPVYAGMTQHTIGQFKRHVHYDDGSATSSLPTTLAHKHNQAVNTMG